MTRGHSPSSYKTAVNEFRRRLIQEALERHQGNRTHAARDLGIHPRMIHHAIRTLKLDPITAKAAKRCQCGIMR